MNNLAGHPGWTYKISRSFDGAALTLDFFLKTEKVGDAKLVVFDTHLSDDVLDVLHIHGDIWCVEDEVEQFLMMNPGRYIWLDGFQRTSESEFVKGKLTAVLGDCLKPSVLGLDGSYELLAFPCPYGLGDLEDSAERESLTNWYIHKLGASRIRGTPFIKIPYS